MVNDIFCIHNYLDSALEKLDSSIPLKPDSVSEPDMHIGATLKLMQHENGVWILDLSLSKYTQEGMQSWKKYVWGNLPKSCKLTQLVPNSHCTPFLCEYCFNKLLIEEAVKNWDVYLWHRICNHKKGIETPSDIC